MIVDLKTIQSLLACPNCYGFLSFSDDIICCHNQACRLHKSPFPIIDGIPILVDFEQSILNRELFLKSDASSTLPRKQKKVRAMLRNFLFGVNNVAARNEIKFAQLLKSQSKRPCCLIVGGGVVGSGMKCLYEDKDIDLICFDVYKSPLVNFIADAHQIPIKDESVDGVWIQAVLEHVLDPWKVVDEIRRVLKPGGIVYSETPFMQQVHEEAYDFTRFTHSGHRWLFKHFEEITSGMVTGAGTHLLWTLEHFFRSLFRSHKAGKAMKSLFFPVRFFDYICSPRFSIDTADGFFFMGRKSSTSLRPSSMPDYYSGYRR